MVVWSFWVVADGKERSLRNGLCRRKFARMQFAACPVVEGNLKMLALRNAESQRLPRAKLVMAGSDSRHGFFGMPPASRGSMGDHEAMLAELIR